MANFPAPASASTSGSYNNPHCFPDKGAPETEILAFRDRLMNRWSIVRNNDLSRVALSLWYHLGRQWAEFDPDAAFDGVRGSILRMIKEDNGPRPVTNIISPYVEEEVIALVKRGWVPKVVPSSNDPRIKAAAQIAHQSLNYRLDQMSWPDKRHQLGLYYVAAGTGLIYTGYDKSYEHLQTIGNPEAVQCPACKTSLASKQVPVDTLKLGTQSESGYSPVKHLENARSVPMDIESAAQYADPSQMEMAELNYCPTCEAPTALEPYEPNEEEAESGLDVFGRSLGMMEPIGRTTLEIDLPNEFYPQDAGVRVTPDTLRRWGRRKIRSLDWWEARAPHVVHLIAPDAVSELLYDDPLFGSWSTLGNWHPSYDTGILDYHANADELIEQPSFRHPLGRYCLCSKDKVVIDDYLLCEGQVEDSEDPVYVPYAMESAARYKIRPNQFFGTTLPEQIISPQNRVNGIDRQLIDERDRLGGVSLMMTPGMWYNDAVDIEGGFGGARILFFQPDPANPEMKQPAEFGGRLFPDSVYQERDRCQADAKITVGGSEVSTGNNPTGVGNTSQLQLLIEQDEKSRSLREDDLVRCTEKSWSHVNEMEWILHADTPDVYRTLGPDKSWSYEQYTGNALRGQTEVTIERATYIEKSVIKREAAREALADGLILNNSPVARRKLLEAYGLDTDINEDTNNQVDQAEKQWVDFSDKQIVRVMDSVDDPAIRYQVFGTHLLTEQGQKLTEAANWDEISRAIAGWEDALQRINLLEQQSMAFYGGRLIGKDAEAAYTKATLQFQAAEEVFKQQEATYKQQVSAPPAVDPTGQPLQAAPAVAPLPPTPPPVPVDIPVLLQDRIYMVWTGMLGKRGIQIERQPEEEAAAAGVPDVTAGLTATPPPDPRPAYVQFRALVEAYRMSIPAPMAGMAPGTGGTSIPVDKGGPMVPAPPTAQPQPQGGAAPPNPNPTAPMPGGGAN